jgi:hypothetical protein
MKLKPPQGCGAISLGGRRYAPDADGLIEVPEEAAADLIQSHGFTRPPESRHAAQPAKTSSAPLKNRGRGAVRQTGE